ncbi:hypothetical protein AKO1_003660 [Acrasis kona]|uniref:F-box domain-containing protein n=1 Tax=Acrasis kona TaxID=1008807 RepID=A0AAW2Z797_9EUKA
MFEELPDDAIYEIMMYLPSIDILRVSAACTQLYNVSKNPRLWDKRLSEEWIKTKRKLVDETTIKTNHETNVDDVLVGVQDPRMIYLERVLKLSNWSKQFAGTSNHNVIRPVKRLWIGFKPIYKIFFHSLPTSFLLPKHLNKDQLGHHLTHIHFIQKCTRGLLTLLCMFALTVSLIFFFSHVTLFYRLLSLILLFVLNAPHIHDCFYTGGVKSQNQWVLVTSCVAACVFCYVLSSVLQLNQDLEKVISFFGVQTALLFINSVLIGLDISVSIMLFGTINVNYGPTDNFQLPGAVLFNAVKGDNVILDYESENAQVLGPTRLPLIPIAVTIGLSLGSGGFHFLYEAVVFLIIFTISYFTGGSVRITGDFDSVLSAIVSAFFSLMVVAITTGILEHKMGYCWLLNRDRRNLSVLDLVKRGGKLALYQVLTLVVLGLFIYAWTYLLTNCMEMIIYLPVVGGHWSEFRGLNITSV